MFKSKKGFCMKSNEELQSYIICLRKQLAVSLNENRILKIKMHRLENELQKKDTQIQNLVASSKDFDIKKLVKQHGKGLILNMQKQIHILEEKLLQNEMSNEVKVKSQKTSDYKTLKRKESKVSLKSSDSLSLSNKSIVSQHSPDQQKVKKSMKSKNKDSHSKKSTISTAEEWKIDDSCLNIIKMLKEQTNTEKYDNKSKNNQISYLLNKLKSFKKATSDASSIFSQKSELIVSTDRSRSSLHSSSTLNPDNNSSQQSFEFRNENDFDKQQLQYDKIDSVQERNENPHMFSKSPKNTNLDSKSDIDGKRMKRKTPIEYLSDSEVSSDEEYSWQSNNIRNNEDEQYIY